MIQFYAPDIETTLTLPETESGHCCRVLRMKEGERIYVTDGRDHRFECVILDAHPKHTSVDIISKTEIRPWWGFRLELCVAPSKHMDRMEWLMEKAVEIGVDRIVLMKCDRSERKVVKTDRLMKIAISAMNQSLKTRLPELTEVTSFKDIISDNFAGFKCFGYCDDNHPLLNFRDEFKGGDIRIMIGPEGDFSPSEVEKAISSGYAPVTFGGSRLRLETAAIYAVTAAHVIADIKTSVIATI